MRTISKLLGLGLLSSMFLVLPACGDDTDTDISTTSGITSNPTTSGGSSGSSTDSGSSNTSGNSSGTDSNSTTGSGSSGDSTDPTSSGDTGSDTDSSDDSSDVPDSEGADGLVVSLCEWTYNCCTDGERDSLLGHYFGDVDDCKDRLTSQLHENDNNAEVNNLSQISGLLSDLAFEIDLTRSAPIAGGVEACKADLDGLECNDLWTFDRCTPPEDDPCALTALFTGLLESGDECDGDQRGPFRDIQCKYGTSCEDTEDGDEDIFKCVTKGKIDENCEPEAANDEGSCEYDLYCGGDGKCVDRPGLGEACAYIVADEPHVTSYEQLYAPGVDPDDALTSFKGNEKIPCEAGLICNPLTTKCVLPCEAGANCGEPIDDWGEGDFDTDGDAGDDYLGCAAGLSCLPIEFTTNVGSFYFHCGEPRGSSQLCNSDWDCSDGFFCNGVDSDENAEDGDSGKGTCKPVTAEGKLCSRDGQCSDGFFCGHCDILWQRMDGDHEDNLEVGDCDLNDDGEFDDEDFASEGYSGSWVCQPLVPVSTQSAFAGGGTTIRCNPPSGLIDLNDDGDLDDSWDNDEADNTYSEVDLGCDLNDDADETDVAVAASAFDSADESECDFDFNGDGDKSDTLTALDTGTEFDEGDLDVDLNDDGDETDIDLASVDEEDVGLDLNNDGDKEDTVTLIVESEIRELTSAENHNMVKGSACSADSIGCVYTNQLSDGSDVDPDYYCISKLQTSNTACRPGSGDGFLEFPNFDKVQDETLPWSAYCANNYLCADNVDDDEDLFTCTTGVAAGQPCDYDTSTFSKGHCANGLHCVNGTCQTFLDPGAECDPDQNEDWDSGDADILANGFSEQICDPFSSQCEEIHGAYYCTVYDYFQYVRTYCVEAGGSN